MNTLTYSPRDSKRFGLVIYKMFADKLDTNSILGQIIKNNIDTAIIRIPTINIAQTSQLIRMTIPFLITDTLAYYQLDLEKINPLPIRNKDLSFVIAKPQDQNTLSNLVQNTFGDYINHYRNNPLFNNEVVIEGYKDWMKSYAENHERKICWLIKRKKKVVGFGSFHFEKNEEKVVEGVLYGVEKNERSKGIFKDLMAYVINFCKEEGMKILQAITQIESLYTQRIWTKMGFELINTRNTIHVNSTLSKSVFERFTVPYVIDKKDLQAMKVTNRYILRQINYHFDIKQNMITQNHKFVNILPLEADKEYLLNFSFPLANKGLLRVKDTKENTYMLVYFYLKHFVA